MAKKELELTRKEYEKIKRIGEKKVQAVVDAVIEIWEQEGSRC